MTDPLNLLTVFVGLAFLGIMARYVVTGDLDEKLLAILSSLLGALITALQNRKKDKEPPPAKPEKKEDRHAD